MFVPTKTAVNQNISLADALFFSSCLILNMTAQLVQMSTQKTSMRSLFAQYGALVAQQVSGSGEAKRMVDCQIKFPVQRTQLLA